MEGAELETPRRAQRCSNKHNPNPSNSLAAKEGINEWDCLVAKEGSCELDVWPWLQSSTCDVISRAAFGSNYEEGRRIFQLLKEQSKFFIAIFGSVNIPGWGFLPTKMNKRMKEFWSPTWKEIEEHGDNKNIGMSIEDVIEE
ncbi:hypothetical protein D8674_038806 [Pyrus ussuriensis x Pyrus communis]|uniref:Uncharacterized protein n=1 Tax=Pyrus ussuriensis x Pyrus communis TaxID=2448454 RepID=A0A5N5HJW4_9ROSA|nr:hypothetical protein D8674_038806 [Pyrus ussuriensis x Pyrus communis]